MFGWLQLAIIPGVTSSRSRRKKGAISSKRIMHLFSHKSVEASRLLHQSALLQGHHTPAILPIWHCKGRQEIGKLKERKLFFSFFQTFCTIGIT